MKRYYLPGEESIAFSLLRTRAYDEADQQAIAALAAAEERIDVMHTMFTLPGFCILNHLLDVCSSAQAMPYMHSILGALEQNDAKARLLIDLAELKGIENSLALSELQAIEDYQRFFDYCWEKAGSEQAIISYRDPKTWEIYWFLVVNRLQLYLECSGGMRIGVLRP